MSKCAYCDNRLEYIEKYNQYYCYNCGRYQQPEAQEEYSKPYLNHLQIRPNVSYGIIITSIIIVIIFLIPLFNIFIGFSSSSKEETEEDWREWPIRNSPLKHISYTSPENSDYAVEFNITEYYVISVHFELNWHDEEPDSNIYENQPDSFSFTVQTPWGQEINFVEEPNSANGIGQITEVIEIPEAGIKDNAIGEWKVNVHCGDCGDQETTNGLIGLRTIQDAGNDWVLKYYYEFHLKN